MDTPRLPVRARQNALTHLLIAFQIWNEKEIPHGIHTQLRQLITEYEDIVLTDDTHLRFRRALRLSWYALWQDPLLRWLALYSEKILPFMITGLLIWGQSSSLTQNSIAIIPPLRPGSETLVQFSGSADLNAYQAFFTLWVSQLSMMARRYLSESYDQLSSRVSKPYLAFLNIVVRGACLSAALWGLVFSAQHQLIEFSPSELKDRSFLLTVILSGLGSAILARLRSGSLLPHLEAEPYFLRWVRHAICFTHIFWLALLKLTVIPSQRWCSYLLVLGTGQEKATLSIYNQYATWLVLSTLPILVGTALYFLGKWTSLMKQLLNSRRVRRVFLESEPSQDNLEAISLAQKPLEWALENFLNAHFLASGHDSYLSVENYDRIYEILIDSRKHPFWTHQDLVTFLGLLKWGLIALGASLFSDSLFKNSAWYARTEDSYCIQAMQEACSPDTVSCLALTRDPELGPTQVFSFLIFALLGFQYLLLLRDLVCRPHQVQPLRRALILAALGTALGSVVGVAAVGLIPFLETPYWAGFLVGAGASLGLTGGVALLTSKYGLKASFVDYRPKVSLWWVLALTLSYGLVRWQMHEKASSIAHQFTLNDQSIEMLRNAIVPLIARSCAIAFLGVSALQGATALLKAPKVVGSAAQDHSSRGAYLFDASRRAPKMRDLGATKEPAVSLVGES